MIAAAPPPRPAHLFAHEQGEPLQDAQRQLLLRLASFADPAIDFHGDCTGRLWLEASSDTSVRLAFSIDQAEGHIHLTAADNGWVRAEVTCSGASILRAWIEDPYEEPEVWPDGADGVGEAPGHISKRGAWLTIDSARFPGVPANAQGYWQVEARD